MQRRTQKPREWDTKERQQQERELGKGLNFPVVCLTSVTHLLCSRENIN